MQTHSTGPIAGARNGAVNTVQSARLTATENLSGVALKLFSIKATPAQPVAYRLYAVIGVSFVNGANASTLSVSGGGAGLSAVDMKAAPQTNYAATGPVRITTADIDITATRTDTATAASAGEVYVFAELFEINIKQPITNE